MSPTGGARFAVADREVGAAECRHEFTNFAAFHLEIGRQSDDDVARRVLESDHQCSGFAEIACQ